VDSLTVSSPNSPDKTEVRNEGGGYIPGSRQREHL
jgi:hypothetical protein